MPNRKQITLLIIFLLIAAAIGAMLSIFLLCAISSNEESQGYCREYLVFFAPLYLVFLLVVGALLRMLWIIVADEPLVVSTQETL